MTLTRYILRGFLRALVAVFLILSIVIGLFMGVENLRRFSGAGGLGDILRVTLLGVPEFMYQVFPLALMLASLVTFLRFARSSELVVMRAAGVSGLRLIAVPVVASVALGWLFVAAVNPFVAATIKRGEAAQQALDDDDGSQFSFSSDGVWLRQADAAGQTVIQAARANDGGTILSRVRMHQFDAGGDLVVRIDAPAARLTQGAWIVENATRWVRSPERRFDREETAERFVLPTDLTSEQILDSFSPPEVVGFWKLRPFIAQLEEAGFSARRHRLFLMSELAKPALFAAMVLIGAAFALRPTRFGQTGVMIVLAVLAGFALYFIKDFAETLGARGQIPLVVAAWTPPIAAILMSLGLLLHLEDG